MDNVNISHILAGNTIELYNTDKFNSMSTIEDLDRLFKRSVKESYLITAVNMINETQSIYYTNKIYNSIPEITIFFANEMIRITNNMIDNFKRLVNKYSVTVSSLMKNSDYIRKNLSSLNNFNKEFIFKGYSYNIDNNIPNIEFVRIIPDLLFSDLKDIVNGSGELTRETYIKLKSHSINKSYYYRAGLLDIDKEIVSGLDNFGAYLYSLYRNGYQESHDILVNQDEINYVKDTFLNTNNTVKEFDSDTNKIIKVYKSISSIIYNNLKKNRRIDTLSNIFDLNSDVIEKNYRKNPEEVLSFFNEYFMDKLVLLQEILNEHFLIFSCKLDAHKSQLLQNKAILTTAIKINEEV